MCLPIKRYLSPFLQQESMQRQSKYEAEQQSLAESLNNAQRKVNDERTRVTELNAQLKTAKSQVEEARKELNDYKEKATRILQVILYKNTFDG